MNSDLSNGFNICTPPEMCVKSDSLEDIVIERKLSSKNSIQGPLLLKLLFVGLKNNVSIYSLKGQYCKE